MKSYIAGLSVGMIFVSLSQIQVLLNGTDAKTFILHIELCCFLRTQFGTDSSDGSRNHSLPIHLVNLAMYGQYEYSLGLV